MFHYKRHIGDYRSATAHLTNDEDLAYMRLLDYYYETESPIDKPLDWLARRLRVKAEDLSVVLADFFTQQDDGWHQKRCDEEISEYRSYCQKNSENGQKGGRPRKPTANRTVTDGIAVETQSQPTRNPDESLTVNREPPTSVPRTGEPPSRVQTPRAGALGVYEEGFQAFWKAYGHKIGKHAAEKAWASLKPTGELLRAIVDKARATSDANPSREFYKHPATWLNGRHWQDEVIPNRSAPINANGRTVVAASKQHIPNMPLGAASCQCPGCVDYRNRRAAQ